MTPDKLPDVVWVIPEKGSLWAYHEEQGYVSERAYVRKEALDAMTAERDELRERVKTWQWEAQILRDERDSAREALAKAQKDAERYRWLRNVATIATTCVHDPDGMRCFAEGLDYVVDSALAAQPETKP